MTDLIDDEIRTLRILAGHLPRRIGARETVCIQELQARGLCEFHEPPAITRKGIKVLEDAIGALDFRSRWILSSKPRLFV